MRRSFASACVSLCVFLLASVSSAAAPKPVPTSSKAVGFATSARVRDLPPARPNPDSKFPAEWERDNEQLPRSQGPFPNVPSRDAALQSEAPSGGVIPGPSVTWQGLTSDDNAAAYGTRFNPPDTNGDVGPNHYVQSVNVLFRVYDKVGNPLTPITDFITFFGPLGPSCADIYGDPIVLYDPLADRWLISQFGLPGGFSPPFHQCVAISQTGDPTGAYYLYDFLMPNVLNDYPHFGVWPDGYYMSDNQFTPGGAAFAGAGLFAFDRTKMLVGDPTASYIYFNYGPVDPTAGGQLPSDMDGLVPPPPGTPNLFMEFRADEYGDPTDALRIYEFHADFAVPANSTLTVRPDLPVAAFDARSPATRAIVEQPAPATASNNLDAIADRLMFRLAYRTLSGGAQSFVLNWTVNVSGVNPTNGATYQAGVRFTELRRDAGSGAVSIQNQVTYAPGSGNGAAGRNIWMGSAAQDNQGNSAVGFSASSTSLLPSILWAGRLAGDPADTLGQGEATMFSGAGVQTDTTSRWGDYSAMSVDPSDDCTFFYTQEYYANNGNFDWATRVGAFKFPGCTAAPKGTLSGAITRCANGLPLEGATISVDGGFVRVSDSAGAYSMTLPPGDYTATVSYPGYGSFSGPVSITDGGNTVFDACLAGVVEIVADGASLVAESCLPANGVIDPGETVTVSLCLKNTGGADPADLVGALQATGGVSDPSDPQSYGVVLGGGGSVCRDFTFTADTSVVCGDVITASLDLSDGAADLGTLAYDFQTGTLAGVFSENFDGVTPPALPAGWTATNAQGGGALWITSPTTPDTAPNDAFVDDPNIITDKLLDSPSIAIATASAQVSFRNFYNLESTYDGGVLEISIGGGAFQDILAAGGSFASAGYNATIDLGFGNPLAGRQAWSGNSGGYATSIVNLPAAAAGQNVVLRWRMGSDNSVAAIGWRIDTIVVTDGYTCCTPIPVALTVDATAGSVPTASLNKVWEPGETVVVEPSYYNGDSSELPLSGIASFFTGPPGAVYTIVGDSADYGQIPIGGTSSCNGTGLCYQLSVDDPAVRPAAHWDTTLDETLSKGAAKQWTLHIGSSFSDEPDTDGFYSYVETIFHNGVTGGCGGTNYCPGNPALRKQMAVFLLKARYGSGYVPPPAVGIFDDVPQANPFAPWIEDLYNRGITGGCSVVPLNYCPDNTVLRQQMAVFLLKTLEGSAYDPPDCLGIFADVPCTPGSGFADWIEELAARGITGGCGGGNYCPTNPNTRGQMAVFLTKTFGLLLYGP